MSRLVAGHELITAYMALHPGWTCRGEGPDGGSIYIETFNSRHIAGASFDVGCPALLEAGELFYAHTFVAVSVAEGFALLAGGAK